MLQTEFICEIYTSHKLTYHVYHNGMSGCHVNSYYSKHVGLDTCGISRIFYKVQTLSIIEG